jgi:hypothetical protein
VPRDPLQASNAKELVADGTRDREHKDLDDFCASVKVEEINFDEWVKVHKKLDLQFPVYVSSSLAKENTELTVRLSRTIRQTTPKGRTEKREKIEHTFRVRESLLTENILVVKGLGDQTDDEVGDLVIIVRVKD